MNDPSSAAPFGQRTPMGFYLRHHRRFEIAFAVMFVGLMIPSAIALARGEPDGYHLEHWKGVVLPAAMLANTLSMLTTRMPLRFSLLGVSFALIGLLFWMMFGMR